MPTIRDYSKRPDIVKAVEHARRLLVGRWEEWSCEADLAAQVEQDAAAWMAHMNPLIEAVLYGMLDKIGLKESEASK